ncbi:hypothetical protein LINPERHAP2_LOCUS36985, partial [Linum perenne]
MRALYFPVFCLLATAFCFFHNDFSSSSSSTLISLPNRRSMRESNVPISPAPLNGHDKGKILDEEKQKNLKEQADQLQYPESE